MRTQGAFFADTAHGGGWLYYGSTQLIPFSGGTFTSNQVYTRNALGDYSLNRTAAGAETYQIVLELAETKRLIETAALALKNLPFQEKFGAAALTPGWPAGAPSLPPFTGQSQLTPPTSDTAKGIQITDCVVVYLVGVVALTSASLSLNRTVFANNVANAITNLPISATALPLVTQANPYVAVRAVTTPTFETADLSDLSLEFAFTMANTGTMRTYGLGMHLNFNYD